MNEGVITLKLEGTSFEETERVRNLIHILFTQGVFHLKNGTATLHYDHEGTLQEIEIHTKRWKRNKPSLHDDNKNVIIEILKP